MPTACRTRFAPFAALLLLACGAKPAAVDLQPKSLSLSRRGEAKTITPSVVDGDNKPIAKAEFEWSSADPKIVTVDVVNELKCVSDRRIVVACGYLQTLAAKDFFANFAIASKESAVAVPQA